MLSCLSLLHHTHLRVARHGDYHRTACGLSVTDEPGLFVGTADAATCDRCRCSVEPRDRRADAAPGPTGPAEPKSVVRGLFEALNATELDGPARPLDDGRLAGFPAHRLTRLRTLFPGWQATIGDLIAEGGRVVTRYHVDCGGAFGSTGAAGPTRATNQTVIFHVTGRRITHAQAIVDDFALWAGSPFTGAAPLRSGSTNSEEIPT
jgi:hypothetical protein